MNNSALVPELSITNFVTSVDFYTRILGFTIKYQRMDEGFTYLTLGDAQLMLDQIDKGRTWKTANFEYPLGRGINLQIEVESIEPILKNIKEENLPLFLEVEEKWYKTGEKESGNKQFIIQDPDGYLLRFTEDLG